MLRNHCCKRPIGYMGAIAFAALLMFGCGKRGDAPPNENAATHADTSNSATAAQTPQTLSYNRDIRPILSDKCFLCHGPDGAAREADLRLDMPDDGDDFFGAMSVIDSDDPASSELLRRIHSTKSTQVMPTPESNLSLTQAERALLTRWVEQGAGYERHWAFVPPPEKVAVPDVEDADWLRDDIDRFVLARLEAQGLQPTQEASRQRWLRRVTYDLTGLPPTPEEVDAFVGDESDDAYERVVDRLLASPRYGERMAVPWLDLARYADTYGYSVDGLRASWPWRDWLVQALNDNLPYDQFLTWQLAGDLLPESTREQQLATAFNRLHRMNAEGGSIREEWPQRICRRPTAHLWHRVPRPHPRVRPLPRNHRYDPIEQREYYELFAFFNSIDESGTTEYQRPDIIPPPSMLLPNDAQAQQLERLHQAVAAAQRALDERFVQREPDFAQWLNDPQVPVAMPELIGDYGLNEIANGNQLLNRVAGGAVGYVAQHESLSMPTIETQRERQGLRLDGDNLAHLPGVNDLDRWTPFTIALWFKVDDLDDGSPRVIVHRSSGTDVGPFGFDLVLEGGAVMARAYRHWPGNAIGVRSGAVVEPGQWVHVVWRYDGSSKASGMTLHINGEVAELEIVRDDTLLKTVGSGHPFGPGGHDLILGQRFRDRGLSGGMIDQVRIVRRAVSMIEAKDLHDGESLGRALADNETQALRDYYFSAIDPEVRAARDALRAAREQFVKHENSIPEIAVMREMSAPRPAYVLNRGHYDAQRTPDLLVVRDTPEQVMPWIEDAPRDRLGLAQWLTHPAHPLASRVAVNRLWRQCFGSGIVASTDNFGLQGSWPTHPQLLDYLARAYVDSGWDTKAMLRRIVLSATYRQDSATTPQQWQDDPHNALLARGPARRLDAEMIRDTALSASGLLGEQVGGPPVYPYQPAGLWREVSGAGYAQGSGAALYRRSLYTVWKRTVPMPNMMAFDTPTREACTAQRAPTNTPLQALVLLNDVQYVEASRALAQRIMLASAEDAQRVAHGFRLLTGAIAR